MKRRPGGVGATAWAMYEYDLVWDAPAAATAVRYPMAGDPDWFVSGFAEGEEQLHGTAAVVEYGVRFTKPVVVPDDDKGAALQVSGVVTEKLDGRRVGVELTAHSGADKVLGKAKAVLQLA